MSCHTWVYKKYTECSDEQKSKFLATQNKLLNIYLSKERLKGKYAGFISLGDTNILEFCKLNPDEADYKVLNNILYIHILSDYPFRMYDYIEDTFTDKTELLLWLKKLSNISPIQFSYCRTVGNKAERICGYSEELENMINILFEKEGENNLYFEFG